jgi:hypothetical protein
MSLLGSENEANKHRHNMFKSSLMGYLLMHKVLTLWRGLYFSKKSLLIQKGVSNYLAEVKDIGCRTRAEDPLVSPSICDLCLRVGPDQVKCFLGSVVAVRSGSTKIHY